MILASASPRRKELLQRAGFELEICPSDIDETRLENETPIQLVERLATQKAQATLSELGGLPCEQTLLAADTIVWTNDDVLGKPSDANDAVRMLQDLSGNTHHVSTGVCIMHNNATQGLTSRSFVETTTVSFKELDEDQILAYVQSGEPMDKAGAYAIQGGAAPFVQSIEGDYNNVVGLPLDRVIEVLDSMTNGAQRTTS